MSYILNTFNDSNQWLNVGYTLFEVDTTAPYGSFVSNYMGAINSTTASDGFAMIDLDAQPTSSNTQFGMLALQETIVVDGYDNYGIGLHSFYGRYDATDSVFITIFKTSNNPQFNIPVDTTIQLHAGLDVSSIEDSIHWIDLSNFLSSGDEFTVAFECRSSWGLAWMIDDFNVVAWNPTVVISGIEDLPTFNGVREVTAIYNLLGQPVRTMESNQVYIKVYNDGTKEKVSVR